MTSAGLIKGKLGADLTIEEGVEAARACAINLLAQLHGATEGDLDRVRRVVKLGGFVNCVADFVEQLRVESLEYRQAGDDGVEVGPFGSFLDMFAVETHESRVDERWRRAVSRLFSNPASPEAELETDI